MTTGSPAGPEDSRPTVEPPRDETPVKSTTLGTGTLIAAGCVIVTLLAIVVGLVVVAIVG